MDSSAPPLVFACAGCSAAGKAAYDVAQELSARGEAQMSCLAGVAAELPYFQKQVKGREVWVVDGCPLECALHVLCKQGRPVARHIRLHDHGVKKHVGLPDEAAVREFVDRTLIQVPELCTNRGATTNVPQSTGVE